MCCLPVVVSAWLCSYMNTVGEEARSKPLNMLEQLIRINPESQGQYPSENYHERYVGVFCFFVAKRTEAV